MASWRTRMAPLALAVGILAAAGQPQGAHPAAAQAQRAGGVARALNRVAPSLPTLAASQVPQVRQGQAVLLPPGMAPTPVRAVAKALVVAVTFPGQPPPTLTLGQLQQAFFGPGLDSVAGYLRWASYGQFRLRGTVVGGAAAGQKTSWLVAPRPLSAYAQGNSGMGTGKEAQTAVGGDLLVRQVLQLLEKAHFSFAPYETAQGQIPYLILAVTSPDAALTGSGGDLWSYEESDADIPVRNPSGQSAMVVNYDLDAVYATTYGQTNGLGTWVHEFLHLLGALDLYDTGGHVAGLGNWSVMATGNYDGPGEDGSSPADLDAFTRLQLGWAQPVAVTGPPTVVTLPPAEESPEILYFPVPRSHVYYLVENREPLLFDRYLPGHGLLVYRVNAQEAAPSSWAWQADCLECVRGPQGPSQPAVVLVGAGGTQDLLGPGSAGSGGSAADPFPGAEDVTAFTDSTQPSARVNGLPSFFSLTNIQPDPSGAVTLTAGSTRYLLTPGQVAVQGAAAGPFPSTVVLTDRLGGLGPGDRILVGGKPVSQVTWSPGGQEAELTLPRSLAPGVDPVVLQTPTQPQGETVAWLEVASRPGGWPSSLRLAVAPGAAANQLVATVTVLAADGQSAPGFGPCEVDGTVAASLGGGRYRATLTLPGPGTYALSAQLVRVPSVEGQVLVTVPGG